MNRLTPVNVDRFAARAVAVHAHRAPRRVVVLGAN
jgi:hypothetical protein